MCQGTECCQSVPLGSDLHIYKAAVSGSESEEEDALLCSGLTAGASDLADNDAESQRTIDVCNECRKTAFHERVA